jgi:N-acetyl-anhydromuramyl-L-alanine amidase AmpD
MDYSNLDLSTLKHDLIINDAIVPTDLNVNLKLFKKLPTRVRRGNINQIILHHDVCLSAQRCFNVLKSKGLSTHFCVDNDGTVFQFADPGKEEAFHALGNVLISGERKSEGFNKHSIGIDISNIVMVSHANKYDPPREKKTLKVQGKDYTGLMPFPIQIEATLKLIKMLRLYFSQITLDFRTEFEWVGDIKTNTPGIWGHAHVSPMKVDPFGFPFERLGELA